MIRFTFVVSLCAFVSTLLAACSTETGGRLGYDMLRNREEYLCNQQPTWQDIQACKAKLVPKSYDEYQKSAPDTKVPSK